MRPGLRVLARALGGRTEQTGMFVAAAMVPRSLQRTLMPRSTSDQAIVTGTGMALAVAATGLVHDAVEAVTRRLVGSTRIEAEDRRWRRATAAVDLGAMLAGFGLQWTFQQRPGERLRRGALRTTGYALSVGGFSGAAAAGIQQALQVVDERTGDRFQLRSLPVALPAGAAFSWMWDRLEWRRDVEEDAAPFAGEEWRLSRWRSVALGWGVGVGLGAVAGGERALAGMLGKRLDRVLPGGQRAGRAAGHALVLGLLTGGIELALQRVFHRIERAAGTLEPGVELAPRTPKVSGGPGSLVPFETLGRQGRRHVSTYVRPEWIERVMGEPARAHPIRVFVGLDSAPTERERVELALAELERTGGFDRSVLLMVSPTGTGYVNYAAVEATEYLTRGDCATVTLQYSKRPSPLSLGRVDEGRRQNRALFEAVQERLLRRPLERRPRVVLFGESLGAHTSQDAFLHEGTKGLVDLGIDRALWIGTPYASEWKQEVLRDDGSGVDRDLMATVNDHDELAALGPEPLGRIRYVMLTHHNDAVAFFGIDLLLACPDWLGQPETRPPGVPRTARYGPIVTFLQTLVDMKNSARVVPGVFKASGHDYRADLGGMVRTVYGFDATDQQMRRIEEALRDYEKRRAEWIREHHHATA